MAWFVFQNKYGKNVKIFMVVLKRNGYTFMGSQLLSKLILSPSEKASTLKEKSNFFPFRTDPFLKGTGVQASKQEVTKRLACKNGLKSTMCILSS